MADLRYCGLDELGWKLGFFRFFDFLAAFVSSFSHGVSFCVVAYDYAPGA